MSNLLFAYTSERRLGEVKPMIPRMQYKMLTEEGERRKVTVPDGEMENFIRFVEGLSAVPQFVDPAQLNLKAGARVKVISGPFAGVEGTFIKLKGHRSRVLCVTLGPLGSSIVEISPECVEGM